MDPNLAAQQLLNIFSGRTDDYLRDGKRAFRPLTEAALVRHLLGKERVGVYPTSHCGWLCFDFDGKNIAGPEGPAMAFEQATRVREAFGCGLIELTRSGLGYHLWVFLDFPWPTVPQLKQLGLNALRHCGLPTDEKESVGHPGVYPHPPKGKALGGKDVGITPFLPFHGLLNGAQTGVLVDPLGQPYPNQLEALSLRERPDFDSLSARFPLASAKVGTAPPPPKGRHDSLRDIAMRLRNYLPIDSTRHLIRAIAKGNGLLAEGRDTEVENVITSAYAKPAIQVKTQFDIEQDIGGLTYDLRGGYGKELNAMKETELEYLIEGLILPGEAVLIASPPGAGKSMISMALMIAATAGKPIFGHYEVHDPLRVLYVNEEMTDREFSKRAQKLSRGLGVDLDAVSDNLLFLPQQGLILHPDKPAQLNAFKTKVLEFKPQIVILDTFIALFGGEEKDAGEVRHWYNSVVVWLRTNLDCAVIVQHHIKKPPEDFSFGACDDTDLLYLIRGSSDLPGAFERVFVLWKNSDNFTPLGRLLSIRVKNPKARSGDKIEPFDIVVDDIATNATSVLATKAHRSPLAQQNDANLAHLLNTREGKILKIELLALLIAEGCSERTANRRLVGAMRRQICHLEGDWVVKNL